MSGYDDLLLRVNRVPGVRGSMIVAADDGLVVDADLMVGVPGPAVAALVASLFQRARRSVGAAEMGDVTILQVEAERGLLFATAATAEAGLLLVVVAERWVNVGLLRVEASRAVAALA